MTTSPKADIRLDQDKIANALTQPVQQFEVFPSIDSTNSYLLGQEIAVGAASICVAEAQPKGRGRHGNQWHSSADSNILMSLSWGFSDWPQTITGLGLAAGLVVAQRLNQLFDLAVKIKWPNDLLIDNAKLGGILIDVSGVRGSACNVVIGLGLNVRQDLSAVDADYAWQDLAGLGVDADRNQLIAHIVNDWVEMLEVFSQQGFEPFAEHWNDLSSYANQTIAVGGSESKKVVGRMLGVDSNGALLLKDHNGNTHTFSDSDVSVRLVESA